MKPLTSTIEPATGEFPATGRFSAQKWAVILGCSQKTIERHVESLNVPRRRLGDIVFITAEDLWEAMPVTTKIGKGGR